MEKERLTGGIYIGVKDVMILNNCSRRQASRELQAIRDIEQIAYGKLTVKAYCEYWKIDYDEVVRYLNPYRQ